MNKIINWTYQDPCFEKDDNGSYYEDEPKLCPNCRDEVEQPEKHDFCNYCITQKNTQTNE